MTGSEADPDVPGPSIPLPAAPLALEEAPAAPLALEEAPAAPLAVEENPASPKEPDYSDDVIPPTPPVPGPRVLLVSKFMNENSCRFICPLLLNDEF